MHEATTTFVAPTSGRKPGGQPGRRGVPRSLVDDPDQCVIIPLTGTCAGGNGCSVLAVYMTQYQLLPYQRTAEVLNELAGLGISPGIL